MEKHWHQRNIRKQNGAAVILLFVIVIVAFAATLIGASEILRYCLYRQKSIAAVEGASLAAANDLSAVVIEDPNYGYIALSDYAPEGQALLAADGEPLPVHSINTIVGTARLDLLIAKQLNNQEFIRLAQIDSANARLASRRLTEALKIALAAAGNPNPGAKPAPSLLPQSFIARDRLGKKVAPRDRARQMIMAYLRNCGMENKLQIESLDLDLGSLASGGGTVTPLPSPLALAEMQGRKQAGGCYVAFRNIPVGDQDFMFTAVGKQSSLVPTQEFRADDGTMPASIVKVNVVFKIIENQKDKSSASTFAAMKIASCSQPFSLNDKSNAGTLVVAMPDGAPQNLRSLQDFLSDRHLNAERVSLYRSVQGDYPVDSTAQIVAAADDDGVAQRPTLADIFARGIYDWMRTAGCRPKIDAIASAVGNRLVPTGAASPLYYLRINGRGDVEITNGRAAEFTNQVVQDGQDYALANAAIPSQNLLWSLAYRDQVRNISLARGGKHAGQMMSLTKVDTLPEGLVPDNKISRKSYLQGGLAVEFVISSPQLAEAR